ncbi:MAG TPA: lysylphosphatidylglycerol synthase transmembrane domain-containing protein [Gaiellaceae bacterium]|nr:lysylphosphatidylglycerol synthase transmembrane domain-containing protein [Gaiellaceae bacterium]
MHAFLNAVEVFWHHLAAVKWDALGLALLFQLLKLVVRGFAWRNILVAAYPDVAIKRRSVFGAYAAGVGVNAIAPARAGDVVKLYLVKRRVPGSTYPTLAPTLVAETLLDFVVAGVIFLWALAVGVVPSSEVLKRLPSVDWAWPFHHPTAMLVILVVLVAVGIVLGLRARRRVREFRAQVGRGFAILQDRRRYLRLVASWQAFSWVLRLLSVYEFLRAFRLTPSLHNTLVVQTVESVSTLLPFTPGGAGTKQGLLAYAFRNEFSVSSVLSFSVGMNIALVVVNVLIGFAALFLLARTLRWRRLADAQKVEAERQAPA